MRSLSAAHGQFYLEGAAFADDAHDFDAAAVFLDDAFRDGETQAGAFNRRVNITLDPIKSLENVRQCVGGNAQAGVLHDDVGVAIAVGGADVDAPASWGVFDRVGNEVTQHLADAGWIGDEWQRFG